ncbi:hypothetical protein BL250_01285 [Erwinia sp. OLTSP20]|uniref:YccT family protein n=1 Tax=unclassified Erwinia TaxID=2622719 RepID=UPI000C17C84D|nr:MULTISPECIES: DUF2057 family protein [unclassified Erwinia]PIJ51360.1 hypothetical protein BV501_04825 [Erwinia sp. OAMSP11]PIJ74144.1 hypothetical protein BK416_05110 [Erwinia sp. OLSSP12]PIJ81566.1 hypothetical protein BLD47_08535 [Erwinia sp. OLCASP19]PIJ86107.1 hypothetical protein BLD46_04905 [Erwinia sp. OLMTSP26]PIJ87855.1 hypothetical protein BLD49_04905 [Erwinia sp. OLMDSP33]
MKSRIWCAGLLMLSVSMALQATTLKLAPDVDLLVLDGRKISGSWLKGVDGIELEPGQHQLLFRVNKTLNVSGHTTKYLSVPFIATFVAETKSVAIGLPTLKSSDDARKLDSTANFQLFNEHNQLIASQRDTLTLSAGDDAEQLMIAYNRANHAASVPRFALNPRTVEPLSPSAKSIVLNKLADTAVLYRWYMQVDTATRQHLRRLFKALHAS